MKLEWGELWAAMGAAPSTWHDTTEDMYYEMLNTVPPRASGRGAFLVGEPAYTNEAGENVYACFWSAYGKYESRYMTASEFKEFIA